MQLRLAQHDQRSRSEIWAPRAEEAEVKPYHCGNVSSQRMCRRLQVLHPLRDLVCDLRGGPPPGPAILRRTRRAELMVEASLDLVAVGEGVEPSVEEPALSRSAPGTAWREGETDELHLDGVNRAGSRSGGGRRGRDG